MWLMSGRGWQEEPSPGVQEPQHMAVLGCRLDCFERHPRDQLGTPLGTSGRAVEVWPWEIYLVLALPLWLFSLRPFHHDVSAQESADYGPKALKP